MFLLFATGVIDTSGTNGCWLPQVSLTPVAKFAAGVVDIGGAPDLRISRGDKFVRGRRDGAGEPIRTKGQTLWYSGYSTYNPPTFPSALLSASVSRNKNKERRTNSLVRIYANSILREREGVTAVSLC